MGGHPRRHSHGQHVPEEWEAAPRILRSQWCQIRLRGSRKVPDDRKLRLVLDRFFEVIDWLDDEAGEFFQRLSHQPLKWSVIPRMKG